MANGNQNKTPHPPDLSRSSEFRPFGKLEIGKPPRGALARDFSDTLPRGQFPAGEGLPTGQKQQAQRAVGIRSEQKEAQNEITKAVQSVQQFQGADASAETGDAAEAASQAEQQEEPTPPEEMRKQEQDTRADQATPEDAPPAEDVEDSENEKTKETADSIINKAEGSSAAAEDLEEREKQLQESVKELSSQVEEARGSFKNRMEQMKNFLFGGRTSEEELLEEKREEVGILEQVQKIKKQNKKVAEVRGKLDELDRREQARLEQAEQRLASHDAIETDKRRIRREFQKERADISAELGQRTADLEAMQGNLQLSQTLVQDAVDAAVSDQRRKFQALQTVTNQESSWLNSLEQRERNFLDELTQFRRNELQRQRSDMLFKMNLSKSAASRGVDMGWSVKNMKEMSRAEAARQFNQSVGEAVEAESATSGSGEAITQTLENAGLDTTDLLTVDGIKRIASAKDSSGEPLFGRADIKAFMDVATDATEGTQDELLRQAGFGPSAEDVVGNVPLAIASFWDAVAAVQSGDRNVAEEDRKIVSDKQAAKDFFRSAGLQPENNKDINETLNTHFGDGFLGI